MTKVIIGSTNPTKVGAIKAVFNDDDFSCISFKANSNVSDQPFTDEETIKGAVNRAKESKLQGDIGIGLEAGVQETEYGLTLINWGALIDEDDNLYLAGGSRILLPDDLANELRAGKELGLVIDSYCNKRNIRHNEGAMGVFTENLVKRQDIFVHIGKLLLGQYLYKEKR